MTEEQKSQLEALGNQQKAKEQEITAYRKLESLGMTDEFQEYSDMLVRTVASKMMFAFTSNSIKSWEDFCLVKGEILARLQPLQEVHEAGAMATHLEQEIKNFYLNKS